MAAQKVKLPDLLRAWPWERRLSPHYETAAAECREWAAGFNFFDQKSQRAFELCDFARLAMLAYPFYDKERSGTGCNLMTLFFVFDAYTDVEDAKATREMAAITMDALRRPHEPRPLGECPLGEMARQFWEMGRTGSTCMAEGHFIASMQLYVDAVVQEAEDRAHNRIRGFHEYIQLRYHTCGVLPSMALAELELDIPEEVYRHPLLQKMRDCAVLLVIVINDLYSYNAERARGEHANHNLLTVVMHNEGLGLQEALDWISAWHDQVVAAFLKAHATLPSWGALIDCQVESYMRGIAYVVRGVDAWSFESQRYFGMRGGEVQRTRELYMQPLVDPAASAERKEWQLVDAAQQPIAALAIHNPPTSPEAPTAPA